MALLCSSKPWGRRFLVGTWCSINGVTSLLQSARIQRDKQTRFPAICPPNKQTWVETWGGGGGGREQSALNGCSNSYYYLKGRSIWPTELVSKSTGVWKHLTSSGLIILSLSLSPLHQWNPHKNMDHNQPIGIYQPIYLSTYLSCKVGR
jgi:hypothetical protein